MDATPKEEKGDSTKTEKDGPLKAENVFVRRAPPQHRSQCSNIPFAHILLMAYRCFVALGILTVIVILLKFSQKQNRMLNILIYERNLSRERLSMSDAIFRHFHPPPAISNTSRGIQYPEKKLRYVVNSSSCRILDYPKFHPDVEPYYKKGEFEECSSVPLLTSVTRSDTFPDYVLKFHKNYLPQYHIAEDQLECCYNAIDTNKGDGSEVDDCRTFDADVVLPRSAADLIHVTCEDVNSTVIYQNLHFLLPITKELQSKLGVMAREGDGRLSVMIVGLGSVSRLNLLRTMSGTVEYLRTNGWFEFEGYHKIHKGVFEDLIGPILTGQTKQQLKKSCSVDAMDDCPWIWKTYAERYYVTMFGDDGTKMDSLRSFGRFKKQPTDFFLRRLMRAASTILEVDDQFPFCIGPKRSADYVLEVSADFASRFLDYPTFSVFWINSVGINDLNRPSTMDKKFISYLEEMKSSGALNKTMFVFLSDHGFQKTGFRMTPMGFLEDSMPFLYIWMPEKFRNKNEHAMRNLIKNKNRLTSHFDLFTTLNDVLGVRTKPVGCPKCRSLFDPVPIDRTCADAGIPKDCCACAPYETLSANSTLATEMAKNVAKYVAALASHYSGFLRRGYTCANVSVKNVISAWTQKSSNHEGIYIIHLETQSGGIFEAVLQLRKSYAQIESVTSLTELTNFPSSKSGYCMSSREGAKWCVCERG